MGIKILSALFLLSSFLLISISVSFAQGVGGVSGTAGTGKNAVKAVKASFLETLAQKRLDASRSASIKRNLFKKTLKLFKDKKKAETTERIDAKILSVNLERTDKLADALDKLQLILDRIVSKGAEAKNQGKDTSSLDAAIANAKTAIMSAQDLVSAQAGKQYIINATSEATLKFNVGDVVSSFRTDLANVHKSVINAKQAVMKAASELAKIANLSGINPVSKSGATEEAK